jgi:hypothetical protein
MLYLYISVAKLGVQLLINLLVSTARNRSVFAMAGKVKGF